VTIELSPRQEEVLKTKGELLNEFGFSLEPFGAGDSLTAEEMRELIKQLEQTTQPRTCPHGRPTMIHLSSRQLEREFGRAG